MFLRAARSQLRQFSHRRNISAHEIDDFGNDCNTASDSSRNGSSKGSRSPTTPDLTGTKSSTQDSRHESTACSSASSLCTCEYHPIASPNGISLSETWPVPSEGDKELPPITRASKIHDEEWPLPLSHQQCNVTTDEIEVRAVICVPNSYNSPNLRGAPAMDAPDRHKKSTPDIVIAAKPLVNAEQLIRETDDSPSAEDASGDITATSANKNSEDSSSQGAQTIILPRSVSRKQTYASSTPPKPAASRSVSTSKATKTVLFPKRVRQSNKALPKNTSTASHKHLRWADVTTNVLDALSDRLFKIDVDEMLPSEKLEELREEMRAKRLLEMEESLDSKGRALTKPLQEGLSCSYQKAISGNATPPGPSPHPPADKGKARIAVPQKNDPGPFAKAGDKWTNASTSPRGKSRPTCKANTSLPVIDEKRLSTYDIPPRNSSKQAQSSLSRQSINSHVFLPSTPFTLTSPLFQHGSIRIEQPGLKQEDTLPDDTLDWTAFQMAIAGTREDEFAASEMERILNDAELRDLVDWWEGFHLELGELEGESLKPQPLRLHAKRKLDQEVLWEEQGQISVGYKDDHVNPLTELPATIPSPSKLSPGPMGYNLGHDLGDYLNWEVNHFQLSP